MSCISWRGGLTHIHHWVANGSACTMLAKHVKKAPFDEGVVCWTRQWLNKLCQKRGWSLPRGAKGLNRHPLAYGTQKGGHLAFTRDTGATGFDPTVVF